MLPPGRVPRCRVRHMSAVPESFEPCLRTRLCSISSRPVARSDASRARAAVSDVLWSAVGVRTPKPNELEARSSTWGSHSKAHPPPRLPPCLRSRLWHAWSKGKGKPGRGTDSALQAQPPAAAAAKAPPPRRRHPHRRRRQKTEQPGPWVGAAASARRREARQRPQPWRGARRSKRGAAALRRPRRRRPQIAHAPAKPTPSQLGRRRRCAPRR